MKTYKTPIMKPHMLKVGRILAGSPEDVKFNKDSENNGNAAFESEDAF